MTSLRLLRLLFVFTLPLLIASCAQVKSPVGYHHPTPPVTASERALRQQVVTTAYKAIGSQYRFGGTTPAGFDCSGLARYAYQSANISIPRTAAQQRNYSRTIPSYNELLPGDLIFFKTGRKTDHVGIYVGDGKFIHASTSKRRVLKTSLDTPYWRRTFVKFGTYIRSN